MNYKASKHRGLAAVEFVLISPLIIVFMAMFIELGSMLVDYHTLNKAVRNGARYAVANIYGTAGATIRAPDDEIKNIVVFGRNPEDGATQTALLPGLVIGNVSVTPPIEENDPSVTMVTVTAEYNYIPIFLVIPFLGTDTNIVFSASAVMETK